MDTQSDRPSVLSLYRGEGRSNCTDRQVSYYTDYINKRSDWTLIKIYTDEAKSGTQIKSRDGFNEMIADALGGKLDLIVTKSVSRAS